MGKPATGVTIIDESLVISISFLKSYGYLAPNSFKSGSLTWTQFGSEIGSIKVEVSTLQPPGYIRLMYKCGDRAIDYKVKFVYFPSNLRIGNLVYFLCPITRKRCRKLYLLDTYFLHREADSRAMYSKQVESKSMRKFRKMMDELRFS